MYSGNVPLELPATAFIDGGPSRARPKMSYPIIRAARPFDLVILSPNGSIGQRGVVDFFAGPSATEQYCVVSWAGTLATRNDAQPHVRPVNVDVLELERPATELHVCALLRQDDEGFAIKRLGITLYHSSEINEGLLSLPGCAPVALSVAFLSQFDGGTAADDSLCCPTSAAMVLRFWGITVDVAEFARRSYDCRHRIYGNWALTAAALSSFGMTAWVQKHASLAELDQTIQAGRPTIVSISYATGELPGAPIPQTSGHLVVVRGYDQFGNVLVCDPAGRTPATGAVTYDRRKFARAWLEHGGIAIHAMPEESAR